MIERDPAADGYHLPGIRSSGLTIAPQSRAPGALMRSLRIPQPTALPPANSTRTGGNSGCMIKIPDQLADALGIRVREVGI